MAQLIEHQNFKQSMVDFLGEVLGGKPQECVLPPGFHPMVEVNIIDLMRIVGGPWTAVAADYIDRIEERKNQKAVEREG